MINGAIYEFSMKSMNPSNTTIGYNALGTDLVYVIDKQVKIFQLSEKDDIRNINERSYYDIRDSQKWTLKNFYTYLQTKQDSAQIKSLSTGIKAWNIYSYILMCVS